MYVSFIIAFIIIFITNIFIFNLYIDTSFFVLLLQNETLINAKNNPTLLAPSGPYGDRTGAPGTFANPAVAKYDSTGLRSSMSATWGELDNALAKQAQADHLVYYEWENSHEDIEAECEAKGIPYVEGRKYGVGSKNRPANYTTVKW